MQTISSREFNQNVAKAKNMSDTAPVCITDRGEPAYVLMNYAAYQNLQGKKRAWRTNLPTPKPI